MGMLPCYYDAACPLAGTLGRDKPEAGILCSFAVILRSYFPQNQEGLPAFRINVYLF